MDCTYEREVRSKNRKCSICGQNIRIVLYHDGKYRGGHYFGKIPMRFTGTRKIVSYFRLGRKYFPVIDLKPVKTSEVEYWECSKCYFDK